MQLPIRDYVVEIVSCNNDSIEGRWSFFGKDSDDSRMQCLKSVLGMEKVNLIKRSGENLSTEFLLRFMKFILI